MKTIVLLIKPIRMPDYLVKVEVDKFSTAAIINFLDNNKPTFKFNPRHDFHCTVLYTKETCTPLPYRWAPIKGSADIVGVDVFGNCIVLLLESDFLRRRNHDVLMYTAAKAQFKDYTPHLTLGYLPEPPNKDELESYKDTIKQNLVGRVVDFYEERARYM